MHQAQEPLALKTEDGYVFFRHQDGSYADAPEQHAELVDMRFSSLPDIESAVDFKAIDINDALDRFNSNHFTSGPNPG